ncbi:hypothetical protein [Burkholderia pseudomallei]|uniref:hypothetical protein n=1 Tax=Burkholderia pseudomallei TaxID=28450 RepID=UPI000718306E|nr:hypothetical protein [Burkholderia pseudomallei]OMS35898.1 hypothetical protein AQ740_07800 [Burkholderia pseudomallei]OMS50625.1 hypothetical protein AQ743_10795 [Burkholderia pseudomallei]OMS74238.1 hypothetical protein AQ744_13235 [Burkholderia pseudomallei]OMS77302.1 hypothetical protein AQ745_27670 [Burkholderia pseudomallei]OMS93297.1 hypothetical protein AQ747_19710 [Burkholderia pseudomallei]
MIQESINQEIIKHLNAAQQIQWAIAKNWTPAQAQEVMGVGVVPGLMQVAKSLTTDSKGVIESSRIREIVEKGGRPVVSEGLTLRRHEQGPGAMITKAAVPVATTGNNPELYRPEQAPGVLYPPTTTPIITALAQMGALRLPPNVRALTQDKLLQAVEIGEGDTFPAVAPTIDAVLSSFRKFGVVMVFDDTLLAATNYSTAVVQYVQEQLEMAANNATDVAMIDLFTKHGKAAASVKEGFAAFDGDLRTSCWIGNPVTLTGLQDAANPNIGPRGGTYKTLQAIPSLAVPDGKLFLVDVKRTAVFDGPQWIERSNQAEIAVDTPDGPKVVHLLQENKTALKITKYADATIVAVPQVITLQ